MKILCIQLARLGDILLSAPALHALKRKYPDAQIDILVRPRFADAARLFNWLNVKILSTHDILEPLVTNNDVPKSLNQLDDLVTHLKAQNYDLVLNFSFSPFSSHLTKMISKSNSRGYSRYSDNSFAITDFTSGYFYSQVGIGRPNRIHVSDLLANLAEVMLEDSDFKLFECARDPEGIVIHIGASENSKAVSVDKWVMIISALQQRNLTNIKLVGAAHESGLANQIVSRVYFPIENLCGKTSIAELLNVIATAELVIGADSAPMHFATLCQVPCLNLSFSTVNFFETGPKSIGSRILYAETEEHLLSHVVANEAASIINSYSPLECVAECRAPTDAYVISNWNKMNVEWTLIKSAYFRIPFDVELSQEEFLAVQQMKELNSVIVAQYEKLESNQNDQWANEFIDQAHKLFEVIAHAYPFLMVLLRWLQVSRAMVGPASPSELCHSYKTIHLDLAKVLNEILPIEKRKHGDDNVSSK